MIITTTTTRALIRKPWILPAVSNLAMIKILHSIKSYGGFKRNARKIGYIYIFIYIFVCVT